jgi:hypothetical protein
VDIEDAATKKAVEDAVKGIIVNDDALSGVADSTIQITDSDKADAVKALAVADISGVSYNSDGEISIDEGTTVTVVKEVYLDVSVSSYDAAAGTMVMDITPKYNLVATTGTADSYDDKNSVTFATGRTLKVEAPVVITVPLPEGFAEENDTIYILHKASTGDYIYTDVVKGNKVTFTNPHGFSAFTFSKTNPAVATITVPIEGGTATLNYTSLQAAVDDVEDGQTIQLQTDNDEPVKVGRTVTFTIDRNGNNFTGSVQGADVYTTVTDDGDGTYTCKYNPPVSGTNAYAISVSSSKGGKVTASDDKAAKGSSVTLTVVPDEGKELDTLTVKTAAGKAITVTKNADGTYSFVMPEARVTVTATFKNSDGTEEPKEENCPSEKFTDVNTGLWYHEAVDYVLEKGVMEGNGNGTFTPNANLTRGQLAQILYNVAGKPEVTTENPFTDVPDTQWYAKAVIWAAQAGVVEGYGNGKFGPNDKISRQDLAVMLWRYAGKPEATQTALDFTDAAQVSDYAEQALLWANEVGIVQGDKGKLNPKGNATRAEAATMLMRYLELG